MEWKDHRTVLSADAGFLDSYNDPRDRLNNFKRINASVRLNKKWLLGNEHRLNWTAGISYSGNIDNVKTDPDIQTQQEDNYKSSYHSGRWNFLQMYMIIFRFWNTVHQCQKNRIISIFCALSFNV